MVAPRLDELPGAVRTRVVALAAEVLPDVPALPPALRRVAAFAPARRARLGATAIVDGLGEDAVRERVATQVQSRRSARIAALENGGLDDPAEAAALDWLVRPEGWEERCRVEIAEVADREAPSPEQERAREERWRARAEQAEQALREARAAHRQQVDELKAEVATLRRRVGELRREARDGAEQEAAAAMAALQEEIATATADRARAEARAEAAAAEAADLRVRLEAAERDGGAEAGARRAARAARAEREEASVRARLLLDTVLEAASGLRRELALPSVAGTPAARVEAALESEDAASSAVGGGTAGRVAVTASLLERYLTMPRSRLIVDGYNVSKAAWPASSLEVQRQRLLTALAPLVARTGAETTVVFDAAEAGSRPPVHPPRGLRVVFSPRGVIADEVVGRLAEAEPAGRVVLVVSDDGEVADRAARAAARPVGARALLDLLAR